MIARPVLRSPLGRASEIGKRRNLCGRSRWGSKCGCDVLSFDQESRLLPEGWDLQKNEVQMLRGFRPTGEKSNRCQAPSGRSKRNVCAREETKEIRIDAGVVTTQFVFRDRPESGGCNRGD